MSLIARELREVWDALRASKGRRREALTAVRVRRLRGIGDIRIPLEYPVSVLAGPNGCGKSTVLFACACAYRAAGGSARDFTPGDLFPDFESSEQSVASDARRPGEIEFQYLHRGDDLSMTWGGAGRGSGASREGLTAASPSGRCICGRWPTSATVPKFEAFANSDEGRSRPRRSTRSC